MKSISNVTIIGANGSMGMGIAGIFASFGDAKVNLVSRTKQKSQSAIDRIKKSVRSDAIENNLLACDYDDLENILKETDIVIEAVAEDYGIKNDILNKINHYIDDKVVVASTTSGLSINRLSGNFDEKKRKNFIGIHFFNPPYNMPLCEIIPSDLTSKPTIEFINTYLKNTLHRKTIICKDEAGFIANRIGFMVLNEVLQISEKYGNEGGLQFIDYLFGKYTGRVMKPIETVDFVGLDIHKSIVDNIYENDESEFKEYFKLPEYVQDLIDEGKVGLKNKVGFYEYDINNNKKAVYDFEDNYDEIKGIEDPTIKEINRLVKVGKYEEAYKILVNSDNRYLKDVERILVHYIVYSLIISSENAENVTDCDVAMSQGFNWCPPIAMMNLLNEVCDVKELITRYFDSKTIDQYKLFDFVNMKSQYDYRRYIGGE